MDVMMNLHRRNFTNSEGDAGLYSLAPSCAGLVLGTVWIELSSP